MFCPIALVILNLFDALATLYGVRAGYAHEMNPFMTWALGLGPWAFLGLKMGLTVVLAAGIAREASRGDRVATWGQRGLVALYGALAVWHVVMFFAHEALS